VEPEGSCANQPRSEGGGILGPSVVIGTIGKVEDQGLAQGKIWTKTLDEGAELFANGQFCGDTGWMTTSLQLSYNESAFTLSKGQAFLG